ncbi:ATP-dependent DNA ligase [Candidatus Pacearchaeota archaeon]|jgi:DNA ligase-1|nr:ATP-dependent DNA ligase [Candidatus Pacearchaeota archaeon]
MITKPMLATQCSHKDQIKYPVLATPKLDGIRCLILDGRAVSRNLKPIPNPFIRQTLERDFPDGCDGELIVPGAGFSDTTSVVMKAKSDSPVNFEYWVFDWVHDNLQESYRRRMERLCAMHPPIAHMVKVLPVVIEDQEALDRFEELCLHQGYEGVMIRTPDSPYKCGRSTEREGWLLKIKRFEDSEARIVGFEEKKHNANEATTSLTGHTERSSCKAGMIPANTLGAIVVCDIHKPEWVFSIGSGFDDALRAKIWANPANYLNQIVKYRYQPHGTKDLPRFPIFLGFRDEGDMS